MKLRLHYLTGIFLLISGTAFAIPLPIEGSLDDNAWHTGSISDDPGDNADPFASGSDWWTFTGVVGDLINLVVQRISADLDPALALFSGTPPDDFIDWADDENPPPGGLGPYGDPELSIVLPTTGAFTVLVWDYYSASTGPHDYSIQLTGNTASQPGPTNHVPEPGTLALLGMGLAGIGFSRRRKNA